MNIEEQSPKYIVADAGYVSESNYCYLEDILLEHTALIPYSTMLKEKSKKWKTDEKKVMNWDYSATDDVYINPLGIRFSFNAYRERKDKNGFVRCQKEYKAEKYNEKQELFPQSLTKSGRD